MKMKAIIEVEFGASQDHTAGELEAAPLRGSRGLSYGRLRASWRGKNGAGAGCVRAKVNPSTA
jgi:hypothetical protein